MGREVARGSFCGNDYYYSTTWDHPLMFGRHTDIGMMMTSPTYHETPYTRSLFCDCKFGEDHRHSVEVVLCNSARWAWIRIFYEQVLATRIGTTNSSVS